MYSLKLLALLGAAAVALSPACATAQPAPAPPSVNAPDAATVARAAARLQTLFERTGRVEGGYPAIAVVAATRDSVPLMYVRGVTRAGGGTPVDASTPFYVASQTKAYMGFLAARLDEEGVLPLDTTLAEIWPNLRLPAPADPTKIRMRDLLTHQAPLTTSTIQFRSAWIGPIPAAEFPDLLAAYTQSRDPGFGYSNLAYLTYGAALEARTGRSWRDWLKAEVFAPLGMNDTSARASDFPAARLPWRHQWSGSAWHIYEPKPDATMHAAGGIYTSPGDIARWIQAHLREDFGPGRPASSAFRVAHTVGAQVELADGDWVCRGYTLGWIACRYHGVDLLAHTGEYEGARSVILLAPGLGAGFAMMANSDSMTGTLGMEGAKAFVDLLIGHPQAETQIAALEARFAEGPSRLAAARKRDLEEARADARWGGWTWRPTPADLRAFEGRFTNPGLGEMVLTVENGVLVSRIGALRQELQPAQPDLFGMFSAPFSAPEAVRYARGADGKVTGFTWNDWQFVRR